MEVVYKTSDLKSPLGFTFFGMKNPRFDDISRSDLHNKRT